MFKQSIILRGYNREREAIVSACHVEICVIEKPGEIKHEWVDPINRLDCSYSQSGGWIHTWLRHIAIELQLLVIKACFHDRPTVIYILFFCLTILMPQFVTYPMKCGY